MSSRTRIMVKHHSGGAVMNRSASTHPRRIPPRRPESSTPFAQAIAVLGLSDPRSTTRFRCRGSVFCQAVALRRSRSWQGVLHDLSLGGIGLLSGEAYEPGKILAVSFSRLIGDVPQPLLMTVVHVSFASARLYRMGGRWSRPLTPQQLAACLHALR
jgi:hypothetical protein